MGGISVCDVLWPRVVFGAGSLDRLGEELELLNARRVLVLCTPGRRHDAERLHTLIRGRLAGTFARARLHVPDTLVTDALAETRRHDADMCVALGGGSAIGLAKALALRGGTPFLAIPTTYSGSEMTPIWGITETGRKRTGRDARVLARTVIYDPLLTMSLPAAVTAASGMNALAHCVEALYAHDANPVTSLLAGEGVSALVAGLRGTLAGSAVEQARTGALYGAWLAGSALAAVSMGLHHRICHALGGMLDLPHAATHAVVLPHVMRYNSAAARAALQRIEALLHVVDAAAALFDLAHELGCATSLRALGAREADFDAVAMNVAATPYPNPRPYDGSAVRRILDDAFHGRRPAAADQ